MTPAAAGYFYLRNRLMPAEPAEISPITSETKPL